MVQADAAPSLPPAVTADLRRVSSGVRRALDGFRPVSGASLFHGLDVDLPLKLSAPAVATVHDLSVFDVPWAFSAARARAERFLVSRSLRQADALIAVSEFTAERIRDRFDLDATVTHLAPSGDFAPASEEDIDRVRRLYNLPDQMVLHVGTIEPRKNVPGLITAAAAVGVPLVLAGAGDAALPDVPGAQVHTLGWVEHGDLAALYSAATLVAYPSRYEGFGLPPIEAMACGAAVLATRVGALPEVLDDDVLLIEPEDPAALLAALRLLLEDDDRRRAQARAGQRCADALTWTATAQGTLDVYRSLGVSV